MLLIVSQKKSYKPWTRAKFIFNVGHIPLQDMGPSKVDLVKLAKQINIVVRKQNILVTLHPDTTKSLIYNESLVDNIDALFALPHVEHTILVTEVMLMRVRCIWNEELKNV